MKSCIRRRRGLSLTSQLFAVMAVGSVLLSVVLTLFGAERTHKQKVQNHHARVHTLGLNLARRAAPLLERGDDLRLAVLAASAADLGDCRVLLLDRDGRVRMDTGLALGGQVLGLTTADGALQREVGDGSWEVMAPALGNAGCAGEVRLRYRPPADSRADFSWSMFAIVFLSSLSLLALAAWIGHSWVRKVDAATHQIHRLADGEAVEAFDSRVGGALYDLQHAVMHYGEVAAAHAKESEEGFIRMARQVVHSLEQRGLVPPGHGERTRRYAMVMADELDLDDQARSDLVEAALLHDIGKSCVRPSALCKAGRLNDIERESLRQHPQRGASLLASLPGLRGVAAAIRHQQEKYDGGGYPDGLRGVRTPIPSRILAIASAYDLLTSHSVYGEPMSWPDALDRLHEDRGEHFDPELLDLFEEQIRANPMPKRPGSHVVISADGVIPYKAGHEQSVEEEHRLEEEQDVILAVGELELELEVLAEEREEEEQG